MRNWSRRPHAALASVRTLRPAHATLWVSLLGVALLVAGCAAGSASAGSAATTTTRPGDGRAAAFSAFRSCLAQHGITLPARPAAGSGNGSGGGGFPNGGGSGSGGSGASGSGGSGTGGFSRGGFGGGFFHAPPGVSQAKFQAAMQACRSTLPKGGFGFNRNGGSGGGLAALQAFRSCLADHGVKIPATGGFRSLDLRSAKVAAAVKTCRPLLPKYTPPSATTATSAG